MDASNAIKPWRVSRPRLFSIVLSLGLALAMAATAQTAPDLFESDLADLMNIQVTSVARKSQKLSDAAAAVYVISSEDIRRSGVTSLPEALRLAPGLAVARIDSNKWAISSRGFNGRFANKLQVLIDGRSVYTPTFSGVYWEVQDTLLEDVDRIEVIRGPGAAVWGSNAVNGVINIITKSASDSTGGSVSWGGGSYEKRFGSARFGGRLDDETYARAYVKGFDRAEFDTLGDTGSHDAWSMQQGGFRLDRNPRAGDSFTLQGDLYRGELNQGLNLPSLALPNGQYDVGRSQVSGFNLLGRWKKALSVSSDFTLQAYYDHTHRSEAFETEERDTFDIDMQHRFLPWDDHEIVWGLNYRWTRPSFANRFPVVFDLRKAVRQVVSGFLQDELTLLPNTLKLTLGAKLEYNEFTGVEGQPNVRFVWTPTHRHSVWGAISRAVRTPSLVEDSGTLNGFNIAPNSTLNPSPLPAILRAEGQGRFRAETVWAYELGYRYAPSHAVNLDLATFFNAYNGLRTLDLRSIAPVSADFGPLVLAETLFSNRLQGQTYGVEAAVTWYPTENWRLDLHYSLIRMQFQSAPAAFGQADQLTAGGNPQQQFSLRSAFDCGTNWELDLLLRYVDQLPSSGLFFEGLTARIPGYTTLDARIAYRASSKLELAVVGQNLLDPKHPENLQELYAPRISQVPRSFYAMLNWRF